MTVVTYAFDITDRSRASDGTYRFGTVAVTLPVTDGDSDHDVALDAFDYAHTRFAEPCDGMVLAQRLVSARV